MDNEPYMPSSGSEGSWFESEHCDKCTRQSVSPGAKKQCIHLLRALMGEYNKRWYYIKGVATCTAFRDRSKVKRPIKKDDPKQLLLTDK